MIKPWVTPSLVKCIKIRDRLAKKTNTLGPLRKHLARCKFKIGFQRRMVIDKSFWKITPPRPMLRDLTSQKPWKSKIGWHGDIAFENTFPTNNRPCLYDKRFLPKSGPQNIVKKKKNSVENKPLLSIVVSTIISLG